MKHAVGQVGCASVVGMEIQLLQAGNGDGLGQNFHQDFAAYSHIFLSKQLCIHDADCGHKPPPQLA